MKILHTTPPNYDKIQKYFPEANYENGTLFTYGDTCYCKNITPDLVIHEETHTKQQINPEEWWEKYYIDPEFRLSQELEAYRNQWQFISKNYKDRNRKAILLNHIANSLSGLLYGNLLSFEQAKELITQAKELDKNHIHKRSDIS